MNLALVDRIPRSGRSFGLLLAFTGMFLVSSDALLVRVAERDSEVNGWTIAFMVGLFSTPVAWSLAFRSLGRSTVATVARWRGTLAMTGLLGAVSTTSFLTAVTLTAASNVVAIIAACPIFAAVLARFALGRQPLQLVEHLAHHERRFRLVCSERRRRPTGSPAVGDGHVGPGSQKSPTVRDVMAPVLQPPVPGLPVLGEFQGYAEPG